MKTGYTVLEFVGNLKTDDDKTRYSVEHSDGGGIEFTGDSMKEVEDYVNSVNGYIETIV
jgi:hypothetical protein